VLRGEGKFAISDCAKAAHGNSNPNATQARMKYRGKGLVPASMETTRPPQRAALLSVLYDAINLIFSEFDCKLSTSRSYTGFVLAVIKSDFPFPPGATAI
jgi:hypothetical protein